MSIFYVVLKVSIFLLYLCMEQAHSHIDNNFNNKLEQNFSEMQHERIEQLKHEQQFKKQIQTQLHSWIIQEIKHNEQLIDIQPTDSFSFLLKDYQQLTYRLRRGLNSRKLVQVTMFEIGQEGLISLRENPIEKQFIELYSSNSERGILYNEGRIYIQRTFSLQIQTQYLYLHLKNSISNTFLIFFDIEEQQKKIDLVLKDEHFSSINLKISTILQQSKGSQINREHQYKWQFGFYEKVERHENDMLGFTVAELIIIIGTSIVQLYCIKTLVHDQLII